MRTLLAAVAILLQIFLTGCATIGGGVWPHESDPNDYYWHPHKLMDSPEAAIGAIKNLQPYFVSNAGWKITSLDIDKYGLRASGTWSEAHNQWVPSAGGFFAGNTYVPVYGGSVQTYSTQQQGAFSVQFTNVKVILLAHLHTISAPYKWAVVIAYTDGTPPITLRVRSKEEARRLISALETMTARHGYGLSIGSVGADLHKLKPEQSAALGVPNGVGLYCKLLFKEGPFERVGLRTGDVIMSIDNHEVRDIPDLSHGRGGDKKWVIYRRTRGSSGYETVVLTINTDRDVYPFFYKERKGDTLQ